LHRSTYLPYAASQGIAALEHECRIPVHLDVHGKVSRLNTQHESFVMCMHRYSASRNGEEQDRWAINRSGRAKSLLYWVIGFSANPRIHSTHVVFQTISQACYITQESPLLNCKIFSSLPSSRK